MLFDILGDQASYSRYAIVVSLGSTHVTVRRAFYLEDCFLVAGVIKEVVSWFCEEPL